MVSTRHTRPPSDALPYESTRYRKGTVSRALRKLVIDGNDGLRGERDAKPSPEREVKVYHWRGAVYAVDEDTPQEWIEAQPKRYLKRKREPEPEPGENDDTIHDDEESDEEDDDDDDEEVDEHTEERRRAHKRRDSSRPARKIQKVGPGRPRKHPRRDTLPSLTSRTPRSHKKKTSHATRLPTPRSSQSVPAQRGRPRKNHDSTAKPARAKSVRNGRTSNVSPSRFVASSRPASASHHNNSSRMASTPQASEPEHPNVAPIPWADMMAGRIAVSMTKFLAVQAQLRKIQHEYALARDLHARVVARENGRPKKQTTGGHNNAKVGSSGANADNGNVDIDRSKLGATVQRTDSRLSRREDQPPDNNISSAISIAASDEGHRERASSFDTAPSHAELSPKSHDQASNLADQPATRPLLKRYPMATEYLPQSPPHKPIKPTKPADNGVVLKPLVSNQESAAYVLANDKRFGTETPEEKSRRLNREWDRVMAWPQKNAVTKR